jgi:hypothetical protein
MMLISASQLQVTSFETTSVLVPALPYGTQEPECVSPKCGPTATPELCPETSIA